MAALLQNRAIVVLGMHRSGTSVVTGVLRLLGIDVGPHLLEARADNKSGFWEHAGVVELQDQLLAALGTNWYQIFLPPEHWLDLPPVKEFQEKLAAVLLRDFSGKPFWALKDPRICRLLPAWMPVLERLKCRLTCLFVARHPLEVAGSLAKRDLFTREAALQIWLDHNLRAERDSRGTERSFAYYDEFLDDWRAALAPLERSLGGWPVAPEQVAGEIAKFVDPTQRHHSGGEEPADVSAWIWEAHRALALARSDETRMRRELDALWTQWMAAASLFAAELNSARNKITELKSKLEKRNADLEGRNKKLEDAREKIRRMESSLAWKLTKPLRRITR